MKFGTVSMWRRSLDEFVQQIELADSLGADIIGVGDSQAGFRELYLSLAVVASHSSRALLGPMVTNPVTRHPAVTASAIATLDRLADGRAVLGLGTGGSAVWTIGKRPARVAQMREYITAVSDLMQSGVATFEGDTVYVQDVPRPVPMFVSAEGPRTLELAGALADRVILHTGTTPAAIQWCRDRVTAGARQACRDPAEIEIWMMLKASVADDRESAVAAVASGLAGSAAHALRQGASEKGVPPEFLEPIQTLIQNYDSAQHAVAAGSNAQLIDSLGLTEFLADYFGLVGTPLDCRRTLESLSAQGIDGVICTTSSRNPLELIQRLGRDVFPHVDTSRRAGD